MTENDNAHPLCRLLRELRQASGMSLAKIEQKYEISGVVVGAYERGDRIPPINKLEQILNIYGYRLKAEPIGSAHVRPSTDIATELRAIADQIDENNAVSSL